MSWFRLRLVLACSALALSAACSAVSDKDPVGNGGSSSGGSGGSGGAGCVPSDELCDGVDNDCDGDVDEGCGCTQGDTQDCYGGDSALLGVGLCVGGTQTCDSGGAWGPCAGEVLPENEACDSEDNDCNGGIDEGFGSVTCGLGVCQVTVDECDKGVPTPCVPGTPAPTEACDGIDDDCDGTVDNGCSCTDGTTQPCYSGSPTTQNVGACTDGLQTCTNGQWGGCLGDVTPTSELCDGLDNDCDGTPDNDNPGGGGGCSTGLFGVCAGGTEMCQSGSIDCVQNVQATPEICDNLDNDCDGVSDNGNPGGGTPCDTGQQGVCAAGTNTCQTGTVICMQDATASSELCNTLDDDCDGTADDGNPEGGDACSTGLPGVCADGTNTCQSGSVDCVQNTPSSAEVCGNSVDEDCDGVLDNGCSTCTDGESQPCYTGAAVTRNVGECSDGTQTCSGQVWGPCTGDTTPAGEQCNNLDDNCDGITDDGNPGGGGVCSTGLQGICAAGTNACVGGNIVCQQDNTATAEICGNSLDDDCDGTVDNGCSTDCDPLNPSAICGAGYHCEPQVSGSPLCVAGTGPLGTYDYCTATSQCNATSYCHAPRSGVSICQQWCRVGGSDCSGSGESCVALSPNRYINAQEWGVCYDTRTGAGKGPPGWFCTWGWNDSDCDCGCGKIDPDCPGPQSNQCTWCDDSSCSPSCGGIDTNENWHC